MANDIKNNYDRLNSRHYLLKTSRSDFWFNATPSRMRELANEHGDDFCVVVWRDGEDNDAYVMPYGEVKGEFVEDRLVEHRGKKQSRWLGSIPKGKLTLRGSSIAADVSRFHNAFSPLSIHVPADRSESILLPGETTESSLREGKKMSVMINAYERNAEARRKCLEKYGHQCSMCGFDFEVVYGDLAKGFIHVHHLESLASIGKSHAVDPVNDLRPVCANCHAVLHLGGGCRAVDVGRSLVRQEYREFLGKLPKSAGTSDPH